MGDQSGLSPRVPCTITFSQELYRAVAGKAKQAGISYAEAVRQIVTDWAERRAARRDN